MKITIVLVLGLKVEEFVPKCHKFEPYCKREQFGFSEGQYKGWSSVCLVSQKDSIKGGPLFVIGPASLRTLPVYCMSMQGNL